MHSRVVRKIVSLSRVSERMPLKVPLGNSHYWFFRLWNRSTVRSASPDTLYINPCRGVNLFFRVVRVTSVWIRCVLQGRATLLSDVAWSGFSSSLSFLLWLTSLTLTTVSVFTEDANDTVTDDRKFPGVSGPWGVFLLSSRWNLWIVNKFNCSYRK